MKNLLRVAALAAAFICSTSASAQACSGVSPFTDVAASAFFCQNTEWLRNRGVTLGCGGTTYCPGNVVDRGSMAAFMNRLGTALTPEILYNQVAPTGGITLPGEAPQPPQMNCFTADSTVATYPRQVLVSAALSGLADSNDVSWRAFALMSTDAGATWTQLNANTVALRAGSGPGGWSTASVNERADLAPNLAYRFVIGTRRDNVDAGTIGNFIAIRCHIAATIYNRNGISSPFDAQ